MQEMDFEEVVMVKAIPIVFNKYFDTQINIRVRKIFEFQNECVALRIMVMGMNV